jgi:hypothetical protein
MILAATRFNEETMRENTIYKREKNYDGCIYGTPVKISTTILEKTKMFVFEMDITSAKRIAGIGMIINKTNGNLNCDIYSNKRYNKYIYYSKYRVNIDEISDDKKELIKKIENVIFKTKAHIQRSIGITRIPEKNIKNIEMIDIKECEKYEKIVEDTKEIFTNKYPELFIN